MVLTPAGLAVRGWLIFRRAAMVCVMYGTLRLALDQATRVLSLGKESDLFFSLRSSVVSGLVSLIFIVFGGQSFLDVTPALLPPKSRPPSPQSPF